MRRRATMDPRLNASTDTMTILLLPAHPTAITELIGFPAGTL